LFFLKIEKDAFLAQANIELLKGQNN